MSEKKGFILPYGTAAQIGRLILISGAEAAVNLLEALEKYSLNGTEPEGLDLAAEMLFEGLRKELDIDREKYEKTIQQRTDAANARWSKTKSETMREDATASECINSDADRRQKTVDSRQEIEVEDSNNTLTIIDGLPAPLPAETDLKKLTDSVLNVEFETLWKDFPRKVGKHDASRHYKTARKQGTTFEEIRTGLWNYVNYTRGQPEKYIMNGSTWFCGHHWEDRRDKPVSDFERILAL